MRVLVYLCFLLSGVTGLVYEVLWGKYLQLFIGASSYAHTVVLATFMGGLAIGNALFGRLCDRKIRKLTLYAILELGIGLACALFPMAFSALSSGYMALASPNPESVGNLLVKILFSAVAILVPTVLMGGTLPVLARYTVRHMHEVGKRVGWLYFINSAGAVFGCVLAGFHLVSGLGLELAMIVTAFVNIAIGLLFLYLRRFEHLDAPEESAVEAGGARGRVIRQYTELQIRGTLIIVFFTGALTMVYELVWIRLLGLVLGSSSYSFSIMLFTFISGIAVGGLIVSFIMRRERDALLLFAFCELGVFLTLILMLPLYERLPYYFNTLASLLTRDESTFVLYLSAKVAMCFVVMVAPAILIGMTLPLASRIAVRRISILGRGVGSVFSVNTFGNLAGAVLAGFFLIPAMGLHSTMMSGIFASGVVGVVLYLLAGRGKRAARFTVAAGAMVAFVGAVFAVPAWNVRVLNSGMYRNPTRYAYSFEQYYRSVNKHELLYHKDGPDVSVVVMRDSDDPLNIWMKVNGKTDASTQDDMATQLQSGHIPVLLHQAPRDVLVVGLGSGVTVSAVLLHPVERVDVVEISDAVIEGSEFFNTVIEAPLEDKRTTMFRADAKDFLNLQPEKGYDIIISEPSNPWIAGIGNLFSVEYFQDVAEHLRPGGIMTQWIQMYETDDAILSVVFNTFSRVFPHVTVWHPGAYDLLLVGSMEPLEIEFEQLEVRLRSPKVHASLNQERLREKVEGILSFLSIQLMSSRSFKATFPGKGTLNSDFFPYLEYEAPRAFFVGKGAEHIYDLDERHRAREHSALYLVDYLQSRELTEPELKELIRSLAPRETKFDQPLLPGLIAEFERVAKEESISPDLYFRESSLALFGGRALWQNRISDGGMTSEDWRHYLGFEADALRSLTSNYASPDTNPYVHAMDQCIRRFPDQRDQFLASRDALFQQLALGPPP